MSDSQRKDERRPSVAMMGASGILSNEEVALEKVKKFMSVVTECCDLSDEAKEGDNEAFQQVQDHLALAQKRIKEGIDSNAVYRELRANIERDFLVLRAQNEMMTTLARPGHRRLMDKGLSVPSLRSEGNSLDYLLEIKVFKNENFRKDKGELVAHRPQSRTEETVRALLLDEQKAAPSEKRSVWKRIKEYFYPPARKEYYSKALKEELRRLTGSHDPLADKKVEVLKTKTDQVSLVTMKTDAVSPPEAIQRAQSLVMLNQLARLTYQGLDNYKQHWGINSARKQTMKKIEELIESAYARLNSGISPKQVFADLWTALNHELDLVDKDQRERHGSGRESRLTTCISDAWSEQPNFETHATVAAKQLESKKSILKQSGAVGPKKLVTIDDISIEFDEKNVKRLVDTKKEGTTIRVAGTLAADPHANHTHSAKEIIQADLTDAAAAHQQDIKKDLSQKKSSDITTPQSRVEAVDQKDDRIDSDTDTESNRGPYN